MRTNWLTQAMHEHERRRASASRTDSDDVTETVERAAQATIGGDTVQIEPSDTEQTFSDTFLTASGTKYGVPRGKEALEARRIGRSAGMQIFVNTIVDQLLGGELSFAMRDEMDDDDRAHDLADIIRDVIEGPHLHGIDLDDLIGAWVDDMLGPGEAITETLGPEQGNADLPVVALKPVDPLTMRRNVDQNGNPKDPPWFQAPYRSLGGSAITAQSASVTPLEQDDVIVMRYPGSHRSDRVYPYSPAMQVKKWLEMIADSTTHHSRFYSDNELPPGLVSVREATDNDIENIRDEIMAAKGDPRAAPVVGSDARWVEIGGSAVDLSVVEEQSWFIQLCGAALGVPKVELSMDDQVNYSTSATEERIIHKRVTRPLARKVGQALTRQLLPQVPAYQALERPFDVELRQINPAQERALEEHEREKYQAGGSTWNEYRKRTGADIDDVDTVVEIGGDQIDYGDVPYPILEAMIRDARGDSDGDGGFEAADD